MRLFFQQSGNEFLFVENACMIAAFCLPYPISENFETHDSAVAFKEAFRHEIPRGELTFSAKDIRESALLVKISCCSQMTFIKSLYQRQAEKLVSEWFSYVFIQNQFSLFKVVLLQFLKITGGNGIVKIQVMHTIISF